MIKKKSVIIGAGSHSRAVLGIIRQSDEYEVLCILDTEISEGNTNETILDIPVKSIDNLKSLDDDKLNIFIAIGDNNQREKWYNELNTKFTLPNLISPFALVDESVQIGNANVICPNVFIGPKAKIGNNNIINSASVIEHEVEISNHCHTGPSSTICGRSFIGNSCFIGANSTVIEKIKISNLVIIGAGSTVIESVDQENLTLVGSPAKRISQN